MWKAMCQYYKAREKLGKRLLFDSTPVKVGGDAENPIFKGRTYKKAEHGCLYCADRNCPDINDWSRHE